MSQQPERFFTTAKAGELLGGLHPGDVRHLIRTGRLAAVTMPVRGRGGRPRMYVAASELRRFQDSLARVEPDRVPVPAVEPTNRRRKPRPDALVAALEQAPRFCRQ